MLRIETSAKNGGRLVEVSMKRVDRMNNSLIITKDREIFSKTIGEIIKRNLNINYLNVNIIYNKKLLASFELCNQFYLVKEGLIVLLLLFN